MTAWGYHLFCLLGLDTASWGVLVRNIVVLMNPARIAHMFRDFKPFSLCAAFIAGAAHPSSAAVDSNRTSTFVVAL